MFEPKEPREFSDMSDYPQNGFGDIDQDYFLQGNAAPSKAREENDDEMEDPTEDIYREDDEPGADDWEGDYGERFD